MSDIPNDLKYTKDHEWAKRDGNTVTIGVTAHAQESLGDVVYVELPKVGSSVNKDKQFGVIESTKAVSELFSPVTGKVVEVNSELESTPDTVNREPYGAGWIMKVELADPSEFDTLLDAAGYQKAIENE